MCVKLYDICQMKGKKTQTKNTLFKLLRSVWLFPAICTIVLLLLTAFKISGSSIGIYNDIFYGPGHKDSSLLLNKPRPIRSDEWVWNSQMIMAQKNNNFERINKNLGNGQDMSLIIDVPYKDWSAIFRPQNLVFFILPFDNAFAFKWWLMAYLLLLACYFFVLYLLPGRRLLAAALALAVLFSPFVQWWYQYITLAPLYYSLFILIVFMHLLKVNTLKSKLIWGGALAYLMTCMALVLYPPFQIACALVVITFGIGYLLNQTRVNGYKPQAASLIILVGSFIVAGLLTLAFIYTRHDSVLKIENSAYPGRRLVDSGGYNFYHLFSGHLDFQLQFASKADKYQLPKQGITNQSEDSNFVLLLPFLLLPSIYLLYRDHKRKSGMDWLLTLLSVSFLGFVIWLFVPRLSIISKLTLLSRVPQNRLIIGFGLLNLLAIVIFIKKLTHDKKYIFPENFTLIYTAIIYIFELFLGLHAKNAFPGYLGIYRVLAFALPVPVIMYLILRRRFELAALGLAAFGLFMTIGVHPLYRGTGIISQTKLSKDIRAISSRDTGRWAVEDGYLENFPFLNGAPSLSGIYTVPQLGFWEQVNGANPYIYNRYAHTNFTFYRDQLENEPTKIELAGGDHFGIDTEPCGQFIKQNDVKYLLTSYPLNKNDKCLTLVDEVTYPAKHVYIYHVN